MMRAAYLRYTYDLGGRVRPSFDHTGRGCLLPQGIVNAIVVVILEVISNEPTKVGFVQHDHVVQEFPATAPYPALRHTVLSGTAIKPFEPARRQGIPASSPPHC